MTHIGAKTIEGLKVGDVFTIFRTFTEQDMIRFADISRDYKMNQTILIKKSAN